MNTPINIHGVEPLVWREVKVAALRRNETAGQLVNEIFREWLAREAERMPMPPFGELSNPAAAAEVTAVG